MEISPGKREEIRAEEIFREEVRASISSPPTRGRKLLQFFNSSFGIFLLSSIFLTAITASYSHFSEQSLISASMRQKMRLLDTEIAYRVSLLARVSGYEFDYIDFSTVRAALVGKAETLPDYGRLGDFVPVFPEFEGRGLLALLWELERLDGDSAEAVSKAKDAAGELARWFITKNLDRTKDQGEDASQWAVRLEDRAKFSTWINHLKISRWHSPTEAETSRSEEATKAQM